MKLFIGNINRVFVLFVLCCTPQLVSAQMVSEKDFNKLVVMKYMEAYSTSEIDNVATELLASEHEIIRPEFHNMRHHALGSELMDKADPVRIAIQHRRDVVDVVMAEDDMVAVRYRIHGVHEGNLYGIPATGKSFDIQSAALFWLEGGQITKSWFIPDEAGLLRQIGQPLPTRKDGRWEAGPNYLRVVTGDEHTAKLLKKPVDSQQYRNKLLMSAYKSKNPPEGLYPPPGGNGVPLRRGFANLIDVAPPAAAEQFPFLPAFPDRVDMIAKIMADGKWVMILFRLTATNSVSLFGIPAKDRPIAAYEIGFMPFDGDTWAFRWFYGDDLQMLLQLGGSQSYLFPDR